MTAALARAPVPFEFHSTLTMTLLTGRRARDLAEMLEHLRAVPGAVIYHHTHHFLVQHQFLSPEPPNDFAYWITNVLLEQVLGEELASIDVLRFSSLRDLREALITTIQNYIERTGNLRAAPPGQEFHFMQSVSFILPTGQRADDLRAFRDTLGKISLTSISYHMFDARLRQERGDNDFAVWLQNSLNEPKLAEAFRRVDPYTHTAEGLRNRLISLVDRRLKELDHE